MSQSLSTEGSLLNGKDSSHNTQNIHKKQAALIYTTMSAFSIFSSALNNWMPIPQRLLILRFLTHSPDLFQFRSLNSQKNVLYVSVKTGFISNYK